MSISNAPASDRNLDVIGYEPFTIIAGETLARAPVAACVSSGFGPRRGGAGSYHHGLDLYTGQQRPIYAAGDGKVEAVRSMSGYGKTIIIRHNRRLTTRYAHLSGYARNLKQGDRVQQGQIIGETGRSGNATAVHLHYEIRLDGIARNPLLIGD